MLWNKAGGGGCASWGGGLELWNFPHLPLIRTLDQGKELLKLPPPTKKSALTPPKA